MEGGVLNPKNYTDVIYARSLILLSVLLFFRMDLGGAAAVAAVPLGTLDPN